MPEGPARPSLPVGLVAWLVAVALGGAGALYAAWTWPASAAPHVLTWMIAGLVASTKAIPVPGTSVHLSADTPFILVLLALGAPREAVFLAGLSQLLANVLAGTARREPYTLPFNVGVGLLSGLVGSLLVQVPLTWPAPLLLAALGMASTNATLVAGAIRISAGTWPGNAWWQTVSVTIAAYLASASLAVFLASVPEMLTTVLLVGPPVLLVGSAYRIHGERVAEQAARHRERAEVFLPALQAMVEAIEARDARGQGHNRRVRTYALGVAGQLGLREEGLLAALDYGALLHDVGRIAVPDALLFAKRALAPEELDQLRRHVVIGSEMIRHIPFPAGVVDVVRHHHERWDGAGYPDGLSREEIPFVARIVAVCDAFDDMATGGGWRPARARHEALAQLEAEAGTAFDPAVVKAFVAWQQTIEHLDDEGAELTMIGAEIGAVAREQARLSNLAYRDELTGLSNGRKLALDLQELCAAEVEVAVLMIDLDGFKGINDHLGHDVGDRALQLVGATLETLHKIGVRGYRNGGDEFVVLGVDHREVEPLATRIVEAIESQRLSLGAAGWISLRSSAGGVVRLAGEDPGDVLRRADAAMYQVKRARRGTTDRRDARPTVHPWPNAVSQH